MGTKHGPTRLQTYQRIHDRRMEGFLREGFVLSEDLRFEEIGDGLIGLNGSVRCLGGIVLEVEKVLTVRKGKGPTALVQTTEYRYHAYVTGKGSLLRYCSPHPEHRPYHHVHRFDLFGTWAETQVLELRSEKDIPTLSEVIEELEALYYEYLENF